MKIYGDENNAFILKELGQRIKDIRLGKGMTQKELANHSGVSFSTVVRFEMGQGANIENLVRIMRTLGLLKNFDMLIPEQKLTPEEIYKGTPKRRRAVKMKTLDKNEWKWGDEE